ncbi:hypothetical protein C0Q70_03850 [Pomacea canaliculata]|uniref:Peptidase M13 C-terminal domain-containing protein n=1 Tax=Pomacea canaliculata TaxID=400727 RepID=A0A2T7PTZ2_POMCA|nr:hypothetical protein C0Q70_03850 [Pomacea canaliculata]
MKPRFNGLNLAKRSDYWLGLRKELLARKITSHLDNKNVYDQLRVNDSAAPEQSSRREHSSVLAKILFTQTELVLDSRELYLEERNSTVLKYLENLYREVHEALGAHATTAAQDAKDVVDFQIQLAKLNNLGNKIGYPDLILNDTALNAKSEMYIVEENNFFGNNLEITKKFRLSMLQKLRKPVDVTEWPLSPSTVNAFHSYQTNEIVFPAGVLSPPFYSRKLSDALMFGSIGFIIGHEITHGFDISVYIYAYRSVIKERGREEDKYPSLPYTQDQLFFIGLAQVTSYDHEKTKSIIKRQIKTAGQRQRIERILKCPNETRVCLFQLLKVDDSTAPQAVQQARSYFRSCMDVDTLSMRGIKPLIDFLDRDIIYPTLQPWWTDTGMTFSDIIEYLSNLSSMGRKIGYPEFVLDDTALNAKSDKYFVNEDDFFGTSLDILVERTVYALQNLGRQEYRTEWSMPIYSVNAFYNPYVNEIVFPAGILTLPILVKNFTTAELYGNLGTVIAHEISHSFHGTGADFDEKGNLSQWWGQKDLKIFQNRSQCLVDQYNKFVDKEMNLHVDGSLTLDENIADNCALKQAFKAYRSVIKERGREEDQHPSLPYTPDQLFFIGFAQGYRVYSEQQGFRSSLQLSSGKTHESQAQVRGLVESSYSLSKEVKVHGGLVVSSYL